MNEKELNEKTIIQLFNDIRLIEGKGLRIGKDEDFMRERIERIINKAVTEENKNEV